jgi:hypothetical protein
MADGDLFKGGCGGQGLYVPSDRDLVIAFAGTPREDGSPNLPRWYSRRIALSVSARRADEKYHGPFGEKEFQLSLAGRGVTAWAGAGGQAGREGRPNHGAVVAVSRVCGAPAGWVFSP